MKQCKNAAVAFLAAVMFVFAGCAGTADTPDVPDVPDVPDTPDTPDAPDITEPVETVSYETESGTMFAPVIEPLGTISSVITNERILNQLKPLKDIGFTRVYMVVPSVGYSTYGAGNSGIVSTENYNSTLKKIGDPLAAYVYVAHMIGLELYAVYKPYEGGGGTSVPEGAALGYGRTGISDFGGIRFGYDLLLSEHPEYRLLRRDDGAADYDSRPVTSVEMLFMVDETTERADREDRSTVKVNPALTDAQIKSAQAVKVTLWVSRDNGTYTAYDGGYDVNFTLENRPIYDANGNPLFDVEKKVLALTVDGFSLPAEYKYIAVTFSDASNLRTMANSMINIYSGSSLLYSTSSQFVRNPEYEGDTVVWGCEGEPVYGDNMHRLTVVNGVPKGSSFTKDTGKGADLFYKHGFEFNWHSNSSWGLDWMTSTVWGIARGKAEYAPGCACEGYEEVRSYWADCVKYYMECGFDGINIRLQSHSTMVSDYVNYGFNEPIVSRFMEMYGTDITQLDKIDDDTALKIMRVRGSYFEQFLEEAASIVHSYGKVFGINLRGAYADPILDNSINEVACWSMPKIILDCKKCCELADTVVIKDYIYSSEGISTQALEIREYAKSLGKEVWLIAYHQQGGVMTAEFLKAADENAFCDGVMLYQWENSEEFLGLMQAAVEGAGAVRITKTVQ